MLRLTQLDRRSIVTPVALEGLEGRRLFANAYTVKVADADFSLGSKDASYAPVAISDNGLVLESAQGSAPLIYDTQTGKTRKVITSGADDFQNYRVFDINSSGVVVGSYTQTFPNPNTGVPDTTPILIKDGKVVRIGTLGNNTGTAAISINNKGDIAGQDEDGGFIYSGGKITRFASLSGLYGLSVTGINEKDQLVGTTIASAFSYPHAFLLTNGKFIDLGVLAGDTTSSGDAINDSGLVVSDGLVNDTGYQTLFTSDNGGPLTTILPSTKTFYSLIVKGIDNSGDVIANYAVDGADSTPHIYRDGKVSNANDLIDPKAGIVLSEVDAINAQGLIVALGTLGGKAHTFLLTPTAAQPPGKTGTLTGTLWNDTDGDGVFDPKETATGGRTVFLDTNGNGTLDAGEVTTKSDSKGKYAFSNVPVGTAKVSRLFPAGYHLSNPSPGTAGRDVIVTVKQNKTSTANLGSALNAPTGTIRGVLFNDVDNDSVYDKSEKPTGIRTVFLDTNGNGVLDNGEISTQSDKKGQYAFTGLEYGTYKIARLYSPGYHLPSSPPPYLTVKLKSETATLNIGTHARG